MDKRFLEHCQAKEMSLGAIGELAGRHPSTVAYWLKRHGLRTAKADLHSAKGSPGRDRLAALVDAGLTLQEIAQRLERSVSSVRYWMDRATFIKVLGGVYKWQIYYK